MKEQLARLTQKAEEEITANETIREITSRIDGFFHGQEKKGQYQHHRLELKEEGQEPLSIRVSRTELQVPFEHTEGFSTHTAVRIIAIKTRDSTEFVFSIGGRTDGIKVLFIEREEAVVLPLTQENLSPFLQVARHLEETSPQRS